MSAGEKTKIAFRRHDTAQPWGFRMQGGSEYELPLFIAQVSPKSIAGVAGLKVGDAILKIGDCDVRGWSHEEAKRELIRCGNEIELFVQRGAVDVSDPGILSAQAPKEEPRVELDEQSINPHMNPHGKYRNVVPKSYQILNEELDKGNIKPPSRPVQVPPQPGPKPGSIFDRQKDNRSQYLQAQGNTIQKTFGQS